MADLPLPLHLRAEAEVPRHSLRRPYGHAVGFQSFDYERLFSLMQTVEDAQVQYDEIPVIKGGPGVPSCEAVEQLILENASRLSAIVRHIGGIPVEMSMEQGKITGFTRLFGGKWRAEFAPVGQEETRDVMHSTSEIQAAYQAALPPAE